MSKFSLKKTIKRLPLAQKCWDELRRFRQLQKFKSQFSQFKSMSLQDTDKRFEVNWDDRYPCLDDNTGTTGFDRHYIYHTAWAARVLAQTNPELHIDISSSLFFSAITSAFIPVEFYDYRPAELNLSNLKSAQGDLLNLPFENNSIKSLSCMHVVEHLGLGRYGDPLDPESDLIAMKELTRVLAPGGNLLFAIPMGKSKVMFNAHRIYSYDQILESLPELSLKQFALIPDTEEDGGLIVGALPEIANQQNYGCGCFWFTKPILEN